MKKHILYTLLFISSLIHAQSADQIINQNLENSGGVQKWRSLNSIILSGDVNLGLEEFYQMKVYHRRPYEKKVVFIVNGKEMLNEGYDGKNGWTYNEISGKNAKVPTYQPDSFDSDLLDYQKKGFETKYIGLDKVEGKECHKIELTKNTNRTIYCFSTQDASLLSEETFDETIYYFDYKNFDGLKFATRMIGKPKEGGEYVIRFSKIEINPNIDNKHFKF